MHRRTLIRFRHHGAAAPMMMTVPMRIAFLQRRWSSCTFSSPVVFSTSNGGIEVQQPPSSHAPPQTIAKDDYHPQQAHSNGSTLSSSSCGADPFAEFEAKYNLGSAPRQWGGARRRRMVTPLPLIADTSYAELVQYSRRPLLPQCPPPNSADDHDDSNALLPDLDADQQAAVDCVLTGQSVFITGGAGTGKSAVLMHLVALLDPATTFVTATTGIAAININGTTLHSFAGIGHDDNDHSCCSEVMAARALRCPSALRNWSRCSTLIIDEVSMLSAATFEALGMIARAVKRNSSSSNGGDDQDPFGGIRLILCGDFLQLPPMKKSNINTNVNDAAAAGGGGGSHSSFCRSAELLCFQSQLWPKVGLRTFYFRKNHRQGDEAEFMNFLAGLRVGKVDHHFAMRHFHHHSQQSISPRSSPTIAAATRHTAAVPTNNHDGGVVGNLSSSTSTSEDTHSHHAAVYVQIRARNAEVDRINETNFEILTRELLLEEKKKTTAKMMEVECSRATYVAAESSSPLHECLAPRVLTLCIGAPVMLLANLQVAKGLVNGAVGTIMGFINNDAQQLPSALRRGRKRPHTSSHAERNVHDNNDAATTADSDGDDDARLPIVAFSGTVYEKNPIIVCRHIFSLRLGPTTVAWRSQLPLRLAWAITVHKSQGMTIPNVEVDATHMQETGQVYVALSRATSLSGLRVLNFSQKCVRANAAAVEFYSKGK